MTWKSEYVPTMEIVRMRLSSSDADDPAAWVFNPAVSACQFTPIGSIVQRANGMVGDLYRLEIGDMNLPPPDSFRDAIDRGLAIGKTRYPTFRGDLGLRDRIARRFNNRNGAQTSAEHVLITSGGSLGLYLSIRALLQTGDELLIPEPAWPHLRQIAIASGCIPVSVPLCRDDGFRPHVELFERLVTSRTRAVVLNSPTNPTGTVYSDSELSALADFAAKYGLAIVSDEEYSDFVFGENQFQTPFSFCPRTVVVRSFSKTLAIPGLRLGYIIAPPEWIEQITKMSLYSIMYNSSLVEYAVSECFDDLDSFTVLMRTEFEDRMGTASKALEALPGVRCSLAEGAIYVWPDFRQITHDDIALSRHLLDIARVVTVPGSVFGCGGEGHLRISLGVSSPMLTQAIAAIAEALERFSV